MSAKVDTVRIVVIADDDADTSWLDQDVFATELEAYRNGAFNFVGVRLEAEVKIPYGKDWILTTISTPGLWGITDDSGESYFKEVAWEEYYTLRDMLTELCIPTPVQLSEEVSYR